MSSARDLKEVRKDSKAILFLATNDFLQRTHGEMVFRCRRLFRRFGLCTSSLTVKLKVDTVLEISLSDNGFG